MHHLAARLEADGMFEAYMAVEVYATPRKREPYCCQEVWVRVQIFGRLYCLGFWRTRILDLCWLKAPADRV
jgi:hypothetical protein